MASLFPVKDISWNWTFLVLLLLSSLTSVFKVQLPLARSGSTMSVSYAVDFASLLLLGPNETMIVAAASACSQCTFRIKERNPMHRTLFSMACLVVTVQAAGVGSTAGSAACRDSSDAWRVAKPLVGAATAYFVFNTADRRDRDRAVDAAAAREGLERELPVERAELLRRRRRRGSGRGVIEPACRVRWRCSPLAAAPLYLTYHSYKVYLGRIDDEQRHVARDGRPAPGDDRSAGAGDRREGSDVAVAHPPGAALRRGAGARRSGMSENEIQGVKTAALLHDIGKLAVPEHILSKPGPLTPEEFQKIRAHPKVGADIVSSVPFPYPVAPLILSHHERWDGKGYPAGLKGEEIPLGARILSVVDYFDALMAERPYHKAMTSEAAIGLLQQEAGQGARPAGGRRCSSSCCPRCSAEALTLDQNVRRAGARRRTAPQGQPATGLRAGAVEEERLRGHRARAPRDLRALRDRAGDGHQPRRRRHDGADLGEADQPRAVRVRGAVPLRRGDRDAALPLRHRHRRRHHPAGRGPQRRGADRLGRAQPPSARQRAAERRSRSGRPDRPVDAACSRRWSAR